MCCGVTRRPSCDRGVVVSGLICFAALFLLSVQVDATPSNDLEALLAFKRSMLSFEPSGALDSWVRPSTPRSDVDSAALEMCNWSGILCNRESRVTAIQLRGHNGTYILGALPAFISHLEYLEELDLSGNQFTGSMPPEWASLRRLKKINLSDNKITGILPEKWSELSGLRNLNVSQNRLAGSIPGGWSTLGYLMELDLSSNQFAGSLSGSSLAGLAAGWSRLRFLCLSNNRFSGSLPPEVSAFESLRTMRMHGNRLDGNLPEEWATGAIASVLTELDISDNQLEGTLPELWAMGMRQLSTVNLRLNSLSGPLPDLWRALPRLQSLDLSRNAISGSLPTRWALLSSLRTLDLANNDLTGSLPWVWGVMSSLHRLVLSDNQLTGDLPSSYSEMVGLRGLHLHSNLFSGRLNMAASWVSMTNLTHIELNNNQLTGSLPGLWKDFSSLAQIELQENSLRGELPVSWGSGQISSVLQHLDVHANAIQGNLPESWSSMSRLAKLRMSENILQGSVPNSWAQLESLKELSLAENAGMVANAVPWRLARQMDVCPTCEQDAPDERRGVTSPFISPELAVGEPRAGDETTAGDASKMEETDEDDESESFLDDLYDYDTEPGTESEGGEGGGDQSSSEHDGFVYDSEAYNGRLNEEGFDNARVAEGSSDDDGTTLGLIIGIVVIVLVLVSLCVILYMYCRLRRRKQRKGEGQQAQRKSATVQRPLRVPVSSRKKMSSSASATPKKQYGSNAEGVVLVSVNAGTPRRHNNSQAPSISNTPLKPMSGGTPRLVYDQLSPAVTPRATTPLPSPSMTPRTSLQNGLPTMSTPRGTRIQTSLYYASTGQSNTVATPRYSPAPTPPASHHSGGFEQNWMSTPRVSSSNSMGGPPQYRSLEQDVKHSRDFLLKSNELANLHESISDRSGLTFLPQGPSMSHDWASGSRRNNDVYASRDGLLASTDLTSSRDIRNSREIMKNAVSPRMSQHGVEPYAPPMGFPLEMPSRVEQQSTTQLSAVPEASFEVSAADITISTQPDTSHYRSPRRHYHY